MLYPGALACWTQDDALQGLASRDKAPECDHQLACQGDDHRLARAETAIGSAGAVPQCQCALLLKQQEAPGELDHAAADPGVAGSGEPLFPPLGPALVRRASQTGVARHCFSVTHGPREHLMDEHIGRFNADADNPSQLPNHGVGPGLRLPPQSVLTSFLDLRGMDHVRLYPAPLEPARQPEAVAAGFEGNRNPRDIAAGPDRLIPPTTQHGKPPFWARLQLLARLTLNAGEHTANQPARLAHLDDGNDRAILVE